MLALLLAAAAFSLASHVSSHPSLAQTALLWVRGIFPPSPLLSRAICWFFLTSFSICSSHAPLSQHRKGQWEQVLPDRRRDRGRKTGYLRHGISVGSSEDGGKVSSMNKENVRPFCCAFKKISFLSTCLRAYFFCFLFLFFKKVFVISVFKRKC